MQATEAEANAKRVALLTAIDPSGEGLRFGLECFIVNGVNMFMVFDDHTEQFLSAWVPCPKQALDIAVKWWEDNCL